MLLDASGAPVAGMAKKLVALKQTWVVYRGGRFDDGARAAIVKANLLSLTPCGLRVGLAGESPRCGCWGRVGRQLGSRLLQAPLWTPAAAATSPNPAFTLTPQP
jgi:hypothetical protein